MKVASIIAYREDIEIHPEFDSLAMKDSARPIANNLVVEAIVLVLIS